MDTPLTHQMTREFMQNIVRQIAFLRLEDIDAAIAESKASRQQWDSFGSLLDPTKYREMLYDGTFDHADVQSEIAVHLREIRVLIDRMETISARHIAKTT